MNYVSIYLNKDIIQKIKNLPEGYETVNLSLRVEDVSSRVYESACRECGSFDCKCNQTAITDIERTQANEETVAEMKAFFETYDFDQI